MYLDPRHLAQVSAILETGSFRDAAEMLGLTQPALSRNMRNLELRLGMPIFEKIGRRSVSTELGRQLAQQGLAIRQAEKQAKSVAEAVRSGSAGQLKVAATPVVAGRLLGRPIGRFLARHPLATIDLSIGTVAELRTMLEIGQVDLVVGPLLLAEKNRGMDVSHILDDTIGILCNEKHHLTTVKQIDAAALQKFAWVMHSSRSNLRAQTESALASIGMDTISIAIESQSIESIYSLLLNSDLLTAIPRLGGDLPLASGLTFLEFNHPQLHRPIGAITRSSERNSTLQNSFIAMLKLEGSQNP